MFSQMGNFKARQIRDLARAIEAYDQLPIEFPVAAGGVAVAGRVQPYPVIAITGLQCSGCSALDATGWGAVVARSSWSTEVDAMAAVGASFPYWRLEEDGLRALRYATGDPSAFTWDANHVQVICCPLDPFTSVHDYTFHESGVIGVSIYPFDSIGSGSFFGTQFEFPGDEGPGTLNPGRPAFSFQGIGIQIPPEVSRMPEGTVCLSARMPVTMTGLEVYEYSALADWVAVYLGPRNTLEYKTVVNGEVYQHRKVVAGVTTISINNPFPAAMQQANLGYTLIGRELHSESVYLPLSGYHISVPSSTWRSFGGGVATGGTVVEGKQRIVDVTNVVNGLLAARKSRATEFYLWPNKAGVNPGSSLDGMKDYALSLIPEITVGATQPGGVGTEWNVHSLYTSEQVRWETMQVGPIEATFRLPSSAAQSKAFPIIRSALIPTA